MESQNLTPQESLQLITKVIAEARSRFEDNGFSFILWGSLSVVTTIAQFVLIQMEYYTISHYPYFLMIGGGIVEYMYRSRMRNQMNSNAIYQSITALWAVIGISTFILSFGFYWTLQQNISPLVLILLSIGVIVTGITIRHKVVILAGIELNLAGFICFFVAWEFHPIVMAIATFIGILIPGVILRYRSLNK